MNVQCVFARNAWKKDLCSNCFKSEVEHWPSNHININEGLKEKNIENLTNSSTIKMNINNIQINNKVDSNSSKTTSILKKSPNNNTVQQLSVKKHTNHVSNHINIINSNNSAINICNDMTNEIKTNCEEKIETIIVKERQKFPQTDIQLLNINRNNSNINNSNSNTNNNTINRKKVQLIGEKPKAMPLISILKSAQELIKYRPKNKCLVFKEGDPLVIGYGIEKTDYEDDSDNSDDNDNEDDSDDDFDDEECFSDDKQLRELTRENTKFNSNFSNFSIPITEEKNKSNDNKIDVKLIDSKNISIDCEKIVCNEVIPTVCEKLVNNGINESFDKINCNNNQSDDRNTSPNSDIIPMNTSSDSSSDEKEDIHQTDEGSYAVLNSRKLLKSIDRNFDKVLEDSDSSSTNSSNSFDEKPIAVAEHIVEIKPKPSLPVKPNLLMNKIIIKPNNEPTEYLNNTSVELSADNYELYEESNQTYDDNCLPKIVSDHIYQEINDNNLMIAKAMNENNSNIENEKIVGMTDNEKREIKLAELAQQLEAVRHVKRPAPMPPKRSDDEVDEEVVNKVSIFVNTNSSPTDKNTNNDKSLSNSSKPKFSIKKLLHKKISNNIEKIRDQTLESMPNTSGESNSYTVNNNGNPKAWKQSEFNRNNLKIIHPIDFDVNKSGDNEVSKDVEIKNDIQTRPEAPPRTPKPVRPSVPTRKKNKVFNSPINEPPPPPDRSHTIPTMNTSIKNNLNDAYNQLSKSNHNNLMAIKARIESSYDDCQYKWTDFEVGPGVRYGSVMIYKDSIISDNGKSTNLLVLENCVSAPIVNQFKHHEELVIMLDQNWTEYHLLSELNENIYEQKQTNSLILQLYTILENIENNNCNHLPSNTINSILICSTVNDILLLIPLESGRDENTTYITLHQFLCLVLEKLLPNSLFESVTNVLCQQSITISDSKTIVQLIAFQTPVDHIDCELQINYWFDINRCKFINQFCINDSQLTQLDYIYLKFLCNNNIKLIRNAIALMINIK